MTTTRYQRHLHHQARERRARTARWRLALITHRSKEHIMSNGSNIDPTPPDNGGTGLPGKNVDDGRDEVAERVQRKLNTPERFPPDPLKNASNR